MRRRALAWLQLLLGLVLVTGLVAGLALWSPRLSGSTGRMIRNNQTRNLEVSAYFYSEVGDLEEFLDDEDGAYGRSALTRLGGEATRDRRAP